jgi:pseudouridylate synthase
MNQHPAETPFVHVSGEVVEALSSNRPVVALETTIISHGMPYPRNLEVARNGMELLRSAGVTPAAIAIIGGRIVVGATDAELEHLAISKYVRKISRRDIATAVADGADGATTVAATMILARLAGIEVFATGGIGGVHRGASVSFDVSADLREFTRTPIIVVSAGAKAILDLSATLEYLETLGVPVLGYQTDEFPAFYSRESGLPVPIRVDNPESVARNFRIQQSLGLEQGIIVANPIDRVDEIPKDIIERHIETALREMNELHIRGKEVTPFLLSKIVELTDGAALEANVALFYSNLRLAGKIVTALCNDLSV